MAQMQRPKKRLQPKQEQARQPGIERKMKPRPDSKVVQRQWVPKLLDRVAVITGGDSGIGRAVAIAFAEHGARVAISYLNEQKDAEETREMAEAYGGECILVSGDVSDESNCRKLVNTTVKKLGKLDIVVNNAAIQFVQDSIEDISSKQLERMFRTNIFSYFYVVKAALRHLSEGSSIINTTSVTAYRGSPTLIDYSATKGAIVSFTRSLAHALVKRGIRVNAVAPGPVWTPLIPATFSGEKVETFGSDVPMGRAGQPNEIAPCYVFLASRDASYISGQVLHPNGGEIVNG
jgi:NAD(P)-dependent dehydrogenase (short-subunit alcohol dehydrogenase family)